MTLFTTGSQISKLPKEGFNSFGRRTQDIWRMMENDKSESKLDVVNTLIIQFKDDLITK
mgnify:CR=1 FL=1